jgi:hypothetical protein
VGLQLVVSDPGACRVGLVAPEDACGVAIVMQLADAVRLSY